MSAGGSFLLMASLMLLQLLLMPWLTVLGVTVPIVCLALVLTKKTLDIEFGLVGLGFGALLWDVWLSVATASMLISWLLVGLLFWFIVHNSKATKFVGSDYRLLLVLVLSFEVLSFTFQAGPGLQSWLGYLVRVTGVGLAGMWLMRRGGRQLERAI